MYFISRFCPSFFGESESHLVKFGLQIGIAFERNSIWFYSESCPQELWINQLRDRMASKGLTSAVQGGLHGSVSDSKLRPPETNVQPGQLKNYFSQNSLFQDDGSGGTNNAKLPLLKQKIMSSLLKKDNYREPGAPSPLASVKPAPAA